MSLPGVDRVLVVIGRTRHKMVVAELEEADRRGWKFVELRLDFLAKAVEFKRLTALKKCPWVATLRRPADGGRWPGSEDERQAILRQAIVAGCFEWVDLETDIADKIRRFGTVKRIVSYHNTSETPDDLEAIYAAMLKQDADVYKLAVMTQTPADVVAVLKIQRSAPKPTVIFGMGDVGFPTRFTALKYGAPWIYAALNAERGIAPGLPSADDFKTTYPVRSINAETELYGVVGDPVAHSFSPVLHNHMLLRTRTNAIYLPFRVPSGLLPAALKAYESVPVQGVSVTLPHKEAAAALAKDADAGTRTAGAANTLVRKPDGTFAAFNTDTPSAVESLKSHFLGRPAADGPPPELNQLAVLILGTGGVARAIAHGLHAEGCHLTIAGRSPDKAHALAEEVKCKTVDWQGRHNVRCDILVNCTPIGMHPNVNDAPVHHSFLQPGMTVFDTVYTPETTMMLREAKSRGCGVVTGVDMFVRQAARQFELFTGKAPDLEKMREIMRKALSPITRALEQEATDAAE